MLKMFWELYFMKYGKRGLVVHLSAVASALLVAVPFGLGLLARTRRSFSVSAIVAGVVALASWHCQERFANEEYYEFFLNSSSSLYIAFLLFVAGVVFRFAFDGGLSPNKSLVAGIAATALLAHALTDDGNTIALREFAYNMGRGDAVAHVFTVSHDMKSQMGKDSPAALGVEYAWFSMTSKDLGMVGVPDYNAYLAFRKTQKEQGALLAKANKEGKADEWIASNRRLTDDPRWPSNYKKPD